MLTKRESTQTWAPHTQYIKPTSRIIHRAREGSLHFTVSCHPKENSFRIHHNHNLHKIVLYHNQNLCAIVLLRTVVPYHNQNLSTIGIV
jgi:hypothetical protein